MTINFIDVPPPGWFVLDVMRERERKWDWVAMFVDTLATLYSRARAGG
jgi:hypothetical protein